MLNPIEAVDAKEELQRWLKTRPRRIQRLAAEFPYGSFFTYVNAVPHFVIGWTDDTDTELLIVSSIVPWNDAELRYIAIKSSVYMSVAAARLGNALQMARQAA